MTLRIAGLLLAALAFVTTADAQMKVSTASVDAGLNSYASDQPRGVDTGITLTQGEDFRVSLADKNATWLLCENNDANCRVYADGTRSGGDGGNWGSDYTRDGGNFTNGTLVGRVGPAGGKLFAIGRNGFTGSAENSGTLYFFLWDRNADNNSEAIEVEVTQAGNGCTSAGGSASFSDPHQYATAALGQHHAMQHLGCGLSGSEWHSNYDSHLTFARTRPADQQLAEHEKRERQLASCRSTR